MRFLSEYKEKNKVGELLGSALAINIITGFIVTILVVVIFAPLFEIVIKSEELILLLIFTCLAASFQSFCLNMMSYYRANNEGGKFTVLSLTAAVVLILGNVLFLMILEMGIMGAMLAQIFPYGLVWMFISVSIFSKNKFRISHETILKLTRYGFPLIFARTGDLVIKSAAIYLLGFFTSLEMVGIYSLASKIAAITSMVLILPFQLAYEPYIFSNLNNPDIKKTISKLVTYLMLTFVFVAFGIVFVFRDLITLITPPEYYSAYDITFFLLPAIAFIGLHYIAQSLLHVKNKTNITGTVIAVLSLISVLLNYLLIQVWGITGLIIVFNFTWVLIAFVLLHYGFKEFPVRLDYPRLSIITVLFVLLLTPVYLLYPFSSLLFYTVIPIFAGIVIFVLYKSTFLENEEKRIITRFIDKSFHKYILRKEYGN